MLTIDVGRSSHVSWVCRVFICAAIWGALAPAVSQSPQRRNSSPALFTPDANSPAGSFDLLNLQSTDNTQLARSGTPVTITAIHAQLLNGAASGDEFGNSVACAGDVNGDGFDDFIIGARQNDAGNTNGGRAYIYFGGARYDLIPDVILTGEEPDGKFGSAVAGVGDLNGDGFDDVAVGAPFEQSSGRVYIFRGAALMDDRPELVLAGEADGDAFGQAVVAAGDLNHDGFADIVIGARKNDVVADNAGSAYIYYGNSTMPDTVGLVLRGEDAEGEFGIAVSGVGDVNADGVDDVLIGAWLHDGNNRRDAGRAYLFYGAAEMHSMADLILDGEASGDLFGITVAGGGDLNGDGIADFAIGSALHDDEKGRVYVHFGGTTLASRADIVLNGIHVSERFGASLNCSSDLNGDGIQEVIVGAIQNNTTAPEAGRAYAFYGSTAFDATPDAIFTGEDTFDQFGYAVAGAGDLDGDGVSELLIGAIHHQEQAGRVYLYSNDMTGTDLPDENFSGQNLGDQFGVAVAAAGDLNTDGHVDLLIGAPANDRGGPDAGMTVILWGDAKLSFARRDTLVGAAPHDRFGAALANAGDTNGDGFADFIVGAAGRDHEGRAYLFWGGEATYETAGLVLTGEELSDGFGEAVAPAGDVNGDGFADVIVGAPFNDAAGGSAGRAYIYLGGTAMDDRADITLTGEARTHFFGFAVTGAGDINGDGFSDVLVGAYGNDAGGIDAGRAYLYYGGMQMDAVPDLVFTGASSLAVFGWSVAGLGDINDDGFDDWAIGAPEERVSGDATGRVYLFWGGVRPDSNADLILTGDLQGGKFGRSIANAGDVNGDGMPDVLIGASAHSLNGSSAGRAFLYFGGPAIDAVADILLTDARAGDEFGTAAASAGDLNRDGLGDLIVGAPGNAAKPGTAKLYLSSALPIAPRVVLAADVRHDQGGRIILQWTRSHYDTQQIKRVTEYLVQRSLPAVNPAWENVAAITATREQLYAYTAATLFDSSNVTTGWHNFRIVARAADTGESWESAPKSGYSVDNLAPAAPQFLNAAPQSDHSVRLSWDANTQDADLKGYAILRSTRSGFQPNDSTRIGLATRNTFVDSTPVKNATNYYRVVAFDVHGNISAPSPEAHVVTTGVTDRRENIPKEFALAQNYPNPFNPQTTIRFALPKRSHVQLILFDLNGVAVKHLVEGTKPAGEHTVVLQATELPSGVYLYRLEAGEFRAQRKLAVVK